MGRFWNGELLGGEYGWNVVSSQVACVSLRRNLASLRSEFPGDCSRTTRVIPRGYVDDP